MQISTQFFAQNIAHATLPISCGKLSIDTQSPLFYSFPSQRDQAPINHDQIAIAKN
jgi:hypothetical protein